MSYLSLSRLFSIGTEKISAERQFSWWGVCLACPTGHLGYGMCILHLNPKYLNKCHGILNDFYYLKSSAYYFISSKVIFLAWKIKRMRSLYNIISLHHISRVNRVDMIGVTHYEIHWQQQSCFHLNHLHDSFLEFSEEKWRKTFLFLKRQLFLTGKWKRTLPQRSATLLNILM